MDVLRDSGSNDDLGTVNVRNQSAVAHEPPLPIDNPHGSIGLRCSMATTPNAPTRIVQASVTDHVRIEVPGVRALTISCDLILAINDVIKFALREEEGLDLYECEDDDGTIEWAAYVGNECSHGESPFEALFRLAERINSTRGRQ